jgi:hypothetical protein
MSFDPKCYELATAFLADENTLDTSTNRESLAQEIQDTIENWIEDAARFRIPLAVDICRRSMK